MDIEYIIKMKKVLITGGTGYIGNYVTKIMAASHPEV
jgi:FlaA1/EpsC-like NDP-sugar epimerase